MELVSFQRKPDIEIVNTTEKDPDASVTSVPSNLSEDANPKRKVITVLILCFFNLVYYADRFGIAGILADIQCAFSADDSQAGLLQTAFIISYVISAPLVGYLGDRYSRRVIMCSGIFIWSCATMTSSFLEDFWSFLAVRALLGIGEGSFSSLAPAIISDLFTNERRSKFLAAYYFTVPVGSGIGYIVFSVVAQAAGSWRWGLRVTPIAGFISVALIGLLLVDPKRGESEGSSLKTTSWWADIKYLATHWSFVSLNVATTAVAFVAGSFAAWGPKYLTLGLLVGQQDQDEPSSAVLDRVSLVFGIITVLSGLLGVIIGAILGAKLRGKHPTADPVICGFGVLASAPLIYLMMLIASGPEAPTYVTFFFAQWFLNLNWSLATDVLMYVIVPTRRATAKAIQLVLNHVLGDAGSPFIIGLVSDAIKPLVESSSDATGELSSKVVQLDDGKDCQISNIDDSTVRRDFTALQYALFVALFVQVIGAFAFIATSWTIVEDKAVVDGTSNVNKTADPESSQAPLPNTTAIVGSSGMHHATETPPS